MHIIGDNGKRIEEVKEQADDGTKGTIQETAKCNDSIVSKTTEGDKTEVKNKILTDPQENKQEALSGDQNVTKKLDESKTVANCIESKKSGSTNDESSSTTKTTENDTETISKSTENMPVTKISTDTVMPDLTKIRTMNGVMKLRRDLESMQLQVSSLEVTMVNVNKVLDELIANICNSF